MKKLGLFNLDARRGVGGCNTFKAYKNLMAVGKINIAGKELWESETTGW